MANKSKEVPPFPEALISNQAIEQMKLGVAVDSAYIRGARTAWNLAHESIRPTQAQANLDYIEKLASNKTVELSNLHKVVETVESVEAAGRFNSVDCLVPEILAALDDGLHVSLCADIRKAVTLTTDCAVPNTQNQVGFCEARIKELEAQIAGLTGQKMSWADEYLKAYGPHQTDHEIRMERIISEENESKLQAKMNEHESTFYHLGLNRAAGTLRKRIAELEAKLAEAQKENADQATVGYLMGAEAMKDKLALKEGK